MEAIPLLKMEIEHCDRTIKQYKSYIKILEDIGNEKMTRKTIRKIKESILSYQEQIGEIQNRIEGIISSIERLDSPDKEVMSMRYIENKDWENIAASTFFSVRHVMRIHKRVLFSLSTQTVR